MAGYGKNARHGKRPAASGSSSCSSTVTMVIFVAFCLFGVWMLTTSSIIPSQYTTTTASRAAVSDSFSRKKPQLVDDTNQITVVDEDNHEIGIGESTDNEDKQHQQHNTVDTDEPPRKDEETQPDEAAIAGVGDDRSQAGEETQSQSEQQGSVEERQDLGTGGLEEQQTQSQQEQEVMQQRSAMDGEDRQEGTQRTDAQSTEREVIKMETPQQREARIEGEEKQIETERQQQELQILNNSENHQEQQQQQQQEQQQQQQEQQQQQTETQINESHDPIQQQVEEEVDGNRQQSGEGGTGTELETQTDTQGSSNQQQQHDDPSQQLTEEKLAGGSNASDSLARGSGSGDSLAAGSSTIETIADVTQSDAANESDEKKKSWKTQADESQNEKERRKGENSQSSNTGNEGTNIVTLDKYEWKLCNVTAGADYIPCLDNEKAIKQLHGFHHYEHRERHCPEEGPTCLVPLPKGYKRSIEWPKSREQIWYNNVPHTKLAEVKGHQNWVKVTGQHLLFPGGGTQFIHGALHYIDFLQQSVHDIAWGKHTRVILDVGCGVASFGGYLFERDVLAMSFAPKDEHEAQVQFALERGIPAISAVMGTQRLQFPSRVFDLVHCARCRVPWHADGGTLLLELNRVLRPGGFFVWSATPVYQKLKEDVDIWKAMKSLTVAMCWDLVTIKKDKLNGVGAAFFRKPVSNDCYDNRKHHSPPMCKEDDDPNAAWYIPLKPCMHRVPVVSSERGSQWPEAWPRRLQVPPYWLNSSQIGVYGKPAPLDFTSDYEHWKEVVTKSYLTGLGIDWSKVRNVMDMRAVYGGFAAALRDLKVWVMNVVNIDSPDTLPIIYERGFFGIYHDWCESFSTYPRTYDLLHADHLFSQMKSRCKIEPVIAEIDRILRPGGKLIVRDESGMAGVVENILKSLHWEIRLTFSKGQEGVLCAEKSSWRPEKFSDSS